MAISKTLAEKYFNTAGEAVGKVFRIGNKYDLKVSGVYADIPENTSIHPDFIIPFSIYLNENEWAREWGNDGVRTYLKLYNAADADAVSEKIADSWVIRPGIICGRKANKGDRHQKGPGRNGEGLIVMLCNDFAKLVIIALVIGSPIGWFLMQKFLEQYAFPAEINAGSFVVAGAGLLVIALLTVIIQSARAAMTNPANVMRNE